jgi:hypothetical protein
LSKRSKRQYASKVVTRLFGAPPVLPGEDPKAYHEMLNRVAISIVSRDFIEEIWVHDLADAAWNLFRWRRIKAAYLSAKMSEKADKEAARLASAEIQSLEGPDQEEIDRFLRSELDWGERVAKYPRANQKFQALAAAAKSTLDMAYIEANEISWCFQFIEKIEGLIATAQDRIDQIMRELHRHRFMQSQALSAPSREPAPVEQHRPKKIAAPLVTTVPHDQ